MGFDCCCGGEESRKLGVFDEALLPIKRRRPRTTTTFIPWVWSRDFHQAYELGTRLGQGSYAVVHDAKKINPPCSKPYAVKILARARLNKVDLRHFQDEIQILLELRHEHILQIHELFKAPHYFFVVMEKLQGGELFERLCEKEFYSEKDARDVCRTVFEAVSYCHDHQVAHRDLKPENLLLMSRDSNDARVKICDFGFAARVPRPNCLSTVLGSPPFMAPEIINYQPYDQRVDNWSLGVIVYNILGGYNPFYMETTHLTYQQIRQANYQFDPEYWKGISPDAKKLIRGLLTIDVKKRISVQEALLHPWMTGRGDDLMQQSVNLKQLKQFVFKRKKQKKQTVNSISYYWLVSRR